VGRNCHWRSLRSLVIAIAFEALAIGMCEFAFSDAYPPGLCLGIMSPVDRICYWFKSGRREPIADLLDRYELWRSVISAVCTIMLAGMLSWSIRSHGRLLLRFRIRTLMVVIAVLPVAWLTGLGAWDTWRHFDDNCHFDPRDSPYAELESRMEKSLADRSAYVAGEEDTSDRGK
jgi:hypothetical protein